MRKIKSIIALILCISALAACTPQTSFVLPEEDPVMTTEQPVAPMPPVIIEPDVTEPVQTEPAPTEPVISDPAEPSVKPISATEQKTDYSDYTAADSVNRLGFMLYDKLQSDDNVFFSPYSIDIALSMLENGAKGNTKAELDELLSLSDRDERNAEFSAIMNSFTDKRAVLQTANSVWVDKDFKKRTPVKEDFISVLQKYYEAEAEYADFKSPKTVDKVNSWISKKTNKMIPKMLSELDDETVMLLINAVYFEGKWSTPFEKDNTTDWTFAGTKGEATVDMMRMFGKSYSYIEKNGLKGVSIPYGEGNIEMQVFVAKDGSKQNAVEIFNKMSEEEKSELISSLDKAGGEELSILAIPKFTFETDTFSVKDILVSLGVKDAFSEYDANLSGIAELPPDRNLYVSDVLHKAKVEVDESGTKAAAATVIDIKCGAAAMPMKETKEFIADEPFIFVIRDRTSGTILFLGTISNLSK